MRRDAIALPAMRLHIWPRGNYMLIALPNDDGSFTATLFLAKHGGIELRQLDRDRRRSTEFLSRNFPDARELMPDCVAEFKLTPSGFLGTVVRQPLGTTRAWPR